MLSGNGGKSRKVEQGEGQQSWFEKIKTALCIFRQIGYVLCIVTILVFASYHALDLHKTYLMHSRQHSEHERYNNEVCSDGEVMLKLKERHHCGETEVFLMTNPWEKALVDKLWSLSVCGEHRCENAVALISEHKYYLSFLMVLFLISSVWIIVHRSHCVYVNNRFLPLDNSHEYLNVGPSAYADPDSSPMMMRSIGPRPTLVWRK